MNNFAQVALLSPTGAWWVNEAGLALVAVYTSPSVLGLDGAYGSDNLVQGFPLKQEQYVVIGYDAAILFAVALPLDPTISYQVFFKKPDGIVLAVAAAVGLHESTSPIGLMAPFGYVVCTLPSVYIDHAGQWTAWVEGGTFESVIVPFLVKQQDIG